LLQDVVYGFRYAGLAILFVVPEFRYREAATSVVLIDLQQCSSHNLVDLLAKLFLQDNQLLILFIDDFLKQNTSG